MAELSCGGTLMGDTTGCASVRSSASARATVSVPVTGATKRCKNSLTACAGRACGS
jgi:hypothetical protein